MEDNKHLSNEQELTYDNYILQQENRQLKSNWNELKESIIAQIQDNRISMINIGGISGSMLSRENDALRDVLSKMEELLKESDVK